MEIPGIIPLSILLFSIKYVNLNLSVKYIRCIPVSVESSNSINLKKVHSVTNSDLKGVNNVTCNSGLLANYPQRL